MEIKNIDSIISYIPSSNDPLSANVVLLKGKDFLWTYDVGNDIGVLNYLQNFGNLKVILSHFHPDHIGNISSISVDEIFQGKNTFGYTHKGMVVEEDLYIEDGDLHLHLFPIASCHAKGSLCLEVNQTYCFLGDSTYATLKGGKMVYNASLLKDQIDKLKGIDAGVFCESHTEPFCKPKETVIQRLEEIYSKREKSNPYIEIGINNC